MVKNLPANAGNIRDTGSVPGLGRSSGEGNGNPPQYSCLEDPVDRGAWWATVHRIAKSWTQLRQLSTHTVKGQAHCCWNQWSFSLALTWAQNQELSQHLLPPVDPPSLSHPWPWSLSRLHLASHSRALDVCSCPLTHTPEPSSFPRGSQGRCPQTGPSFTATSPSSRLPFGSSTIRSSIPLWPLTSSRTAPPRPQSTRNAATPSIHSHVHLLSAHGVRGPMPRLRSHSLVKRRPELIQRTFHSWEGLGTGEN